MPIGAVHVEVEDEFVISSIPGRAVELANSFAFSR
jgi:hypothetical protein